MDFAIIRNNRQRDALIAHLKERRLPFKAAFQDCYPTRSVDMNAYLWGFIYLPIAQAVGHTPEEVHEAYKRLYNFRHDFKYNEDTGKWEIEAAVGSTTEMTTKDAWEYAEGIRSDAEVDLHLTLALPEEAFVPELKFEDEK